MLFAYLKEKSGFDADTNIVFHKRTHDLFSKSADDLLTGITFVAAFRNKSINYSSNVF